MHINYVMKLIEENCAACEILSQHEEEERDYERISRLSHIMSDFF